MTHRYRLRLASWRHSPAEDPYLKLRFKRSQYPPSGTEVFQPLRLPDYCELEAGGELLAGLRRATCRATVGLNPGLYNVPLGDGPFCQLELLSGARVDATLELGRSPGQSEPHLRLIDLRFEPALTLYNVLQTLIQLHEVIDDRYLGTLKELTPRLPPWLKQLGELALGSAEGAAMILLERAVAIPRGSIDRLHYSFSGRIRWFDQLEVRFDEVVLPAAVVPAIHAPLSRLLSGEPLATAAVVASAQDLTETAQSVADALGSLQGELLLELSLPRLELEAKTIDGTLVQVGVAQHEPLAVQAQLAGRFHGTELQLEADPVQVSAGQSETQLELALRGTAAIDLQRSEQPLWRRLALELEAELRSGSRWPQLALELRSEETLAKGHGFFPLRLEQLALAGALALSYDGSRLELGPTSALSWAAKVACEQPWRVERALSSALGELQAQLRGGLQPRIEGGWQLQTTLGGDFEAIIRSQISALPELDITYERLISQLGGRLELTLDGALELLPSGAVQLGLGGSRFGLQLTQGELHLPPRWLTIPAGTRIEGEVLAGALTPTGLQGIALGLRWDLLGQPCLLNYRDQAVSLFTEQLRRGSLTMHLEPSGKLSFSGDQEGLYGARYFNALINPASDPEQLLSLVRDEDAVAHVVAGLSVFAPVLAEALGDLRALYLEARRIISRERLRQIGDVIPRPMLARLFSLLLVGQPRLSRRLEAVIKGVTEGQGLNLSEARQLLLEELREFELDYEINALLHWLDLVLSPGAPLEPSRPEKELPLALDPAYAEELCELPTATQIYQAQRSGLSPAWAQRLAELAPQLTRKQLGAILERAHRRWRRQDLARLRYAYEVKKRVEVISEWYGGVEYALQALTIATFLGEAVGPLPGINHPLSLEPEAWPPPCALGPEEVAVLLQAGLAAGMQNRRSQLNNRMLLELMRRQPPELTRAVFIELGHQSPRALSGILYAFLDQDQDQLATPLDLVELLSDRLGIPVPRQRDFLAGGHKARQSYYEALSRVADQIIEEANSYLARKAHLQELQHPVPPELQLQPSLESLAERAQDAIARADQLAGQCRFDGRRGGPRSKARAAYGRAYSACGRLLEQEPRAFQLPWLRAFWVRNEEALRVQSVVRNYQQDIDQVRHWLHLRAGGEAIADEQQLLQTVVQTIYWRQEDAQQLLGDPLVRLLIDPPPGRYDFSIISCMGVITDGKDGCELEDAYRRLGQLRGVAVHRAHTGTARSLEYNAARIIEAIEACATPWGIIGYSQGCANALLAESQLYSGTPEQQRLLDRLVCRNMLFSAANGSAHGSSGMEKFAQALVQGERYLKHYQALFSWEAIKAALRVARAMLDSRMFVGVLGGAYSLSFERARQLHRDGQFLDRVPTSCCRAVTDDRYVPETLEYLFHVLKKLTRGAPQDTQVLINDAVGYSTRVRNERTRVLERCAMTSLPLSAHHWAPLSSEIGFVTTERDRQLAIYQGPKDYLVWPWVEVNARFGLIRRR